MVDPSAFEAGASSGSESIVGVILAAGTSERYGSENKLLATIDGEPMIRRAVRPFVEHGLASVGVVLGHDAAAVRAALDDFDVDFVDNPHYAEGQSRSVQAGTRYARAHDADAILFGLGDMPRVREQTVALVCDAFRSGLAGVIPAAYAGQRGNPVLFSAAYFDALDEIEGDIGGRALLRESNDVVCVETGDPGVLRDVNRPDEHA